MNETAIEREAKRLALKWVNDRRRADGKQAIRQVGKVWWSENGDRWRVKARAIWEARDGKR